jgi:uncharacterized protein (TIGR03435 family)
MRLFTDVNGSARIPVRAHHVLLLLTTAVLAFAQPANTPKFEVADVHASPHTLRPVPAGPFYGDGRYEMQSVNLLDMIHTAYGVDPERVYGGPTWLEMERFDVTAKAPNGSNAEQRKLMLQALLADRFKLVFHNDSKPMPAYGLTVAKSGKLQEAGEREETGCNFKVESAPQQPQQANPGGPPPTIQIPVLSYTCHSISMAAFAANLNSIPAGPSLDDKVAVDQTGLKGVYDFSFQYTPAIPAGLNVNVVGQQQPFADVMERELGLKLQLTTAPLPVITVDSAQKPTPNSPDVAKAFPPPPSEFDVAELKPSPPGPAGGGKGGATAEIKNGRVIVPGITLQNLIMAAWELNGPDELIGAPKWLNSDRFDLIAKAPAGVALGDLMPQNNRSMPINLKALEPMLRALLVERFKLTVHTEQRPMEAYSLVAVKPKMQKSDPAARTRWNEGPAPDGKDPRKANPVLSRLVTCQNVTMAQFADLLPSIASGYVHNEVLDKTGLEGGWDFTLSFSGAGALNGGGEGARKGDGPPAQQSGAAEASDPSGGLSLLDAMQKQVGLKLEMQKRPFPVLVIDHIEQKPTDN